MNAQIANWGVELAFIRTTVGAEFDVAKSCGKTPGNEGCRFFGTYGYFDLAAVSCFHQLSTPYLVLLDRRIVESAPFRFFADAKNQSQDQFEKDLDSWPAAILVLAKLNSVVSNGGGGTARWIAAQQVRKEFPNAHVFFGLGHSELLLITGGANLPEMLKAVTGRLRKLRDANKSEAPLFAKTTTFPLLSCSKIHSTGNYGSLEGQFEPVITASCEPSVEQQVAANLKDYNVVVKNVYGKSDILICWKQPITTAELAQFLTNLRQQWGVPGLLTKTSTYLENSISPEFDKNVLAQTVSSHRNSSELMTQEEELRLFAMLRNIKTNSIRAALSDLALRLSACLNDSQLTEHYTDMANIFAYLPDLIEGLDKEETATDAAFTAEAVTDLARAAINQRYAALELHPETLAHAHAPLLCDIPSIVAAATCLPFYIFDRLMPDKRAQELWPGFVLFGGASSPQYLHYDVLGLPPSSLFSPIDVWWKITHEVAHAIFRILQVSSKIPANTMQYVTESLRDTGVTDYHLINELFANWFDWKYVFQGDMEFYLKCIWQSWVRLPIVHESKSQYLTRSFSVFICPRLDELVDLLPQRWDRAGLIWLEARWNEFIAILKTVPGMEDYLNLTPTEKDETFTLSFSSIRILQFFQHSFEKKCSVENLQKRLHPTYDNLEKHIEMLENGEVIAEPITDPCRLHLQLFRSLNNRQPSLATEIAYLFSLENTYRIARQPT